MIVITINKSLYSNTNLIRSVIIHADPQIPRILRLNFNSRLSLAQRATIANLSGVVNVAPETLLGAASDFSLRLIILLILLFGVFLKK